MSVDPIDTLFHTERLRVRRMGPGDLDALLEVYSDRDAMRWVDDGEPLSPENAARWVHVTAQNNATRGYGMCPVEFRATGAIVGFCGLVHPRGQAEAELKYAFRREVWGQGIASEIALAMREYGEREHGLREIIATVAPEHLASQRVLIKAGFKPWSTRRNDNGSTTLVFRWHADLELPHRHAGP